MQTYEIDQKTIDAIAAASEEFGRCIDTSTEHGRVLCGTLIKASLPWDASPNWELRHKSPTDALLVDGLPAWQFVDQSHIEDVYQTVLLASLRRGLPWAWSEQQAVFQRILNREQYIEVGHAPAGDPSMPHLGCSGYPVTAPETITLSVGVSADRVRVGWIDIGAMLEHMPADLLQAFRQPSTLLSRLASAPNCMRWCAKTRTTADTSSRLARRVCVPRRKFPLRQ